MARSRTWLGYPAARWVVEGGAGALLGLALAAGGGWTVWAALAIVAALWTVRCITGLLAALLAR